VNWAQYPYLFPHKLALSRVVFFASHLAFLLDLLRCHLLDLQKKCLPFTGFFNAFPLPYK
jgi:hypothetical protein